MSDISKQIADFSPEKRKLLELLLKDEGVDLARSVIVPQKRDTNSFPLSFAQQRLWFIDQLEPGSALYNIPLAFQIHGALTLEMLEQVLNAIVRRHESLRTVFSSSNGGPTQTVLPEQLVKPHYIDLRGVSFSDRRAEAMRRAAEEAQRPFDLSTGPLLRVAVLQIGKNEFWVVLTVHHIVSDGWSMGILVQEIVETFSALASGGSPKLPDLPLQYVDFACWQRDWLQGEELDRQLQYWKNQLRGSAQVLELPTDFPRPLTPSNQGATYEFELPPDLVGLLQSTAREEDATLFMILLAGFQVLLYRYTGQSGFNVGTPIANRNRAEIEGLIGFFVNTLAMRAAVDGNMGFRELLKNVRQSTLGAYAHQDLPFEKLVEELDPDRSMNRAPLFQVMFALQNVPVRSFALPGLILEPIEVDKGTSSFDLTLLMFEQPNGLRGLIEYSKDLFTASTISRMAEHLTTLLRAVTATPDRSIAELPMLATAEHQQVVFGWNATQTESAKAELTMQELFESAVTKDPEAVAVELRGESLTYGELNDRANQLAHYLIRHGVGPEILVGICVERSVEMIVGILGILKSGGAYVPLDPSYPRDRLAFMFEDSSVHFLLTWHGMLEDLPENHPELICLDDEKEAISRESARSPGRRAHPDNLAYIIYTSGSTGVPKGTLLHHRGSCNLIREWCRAFALGPESRWLQFFSLSFDGSVGDIFPVLASGGTLCLVPHEVVTSVQDLHQYFRDQEITHTMMTPSFLSVFPSEELQNLRVLLAAGEICTKELADRWSPGRRFFNVYGPTETTVIASWCEWHDEFPGAATVPVGRPISNDQYYILDSYLKPLPAGIPGELHIGGLGLARGYLKRPDLTAQK
jgi:amino acid adenylation domain-containing protein